MDEDLIKAIKQFGINKLVSKHGFGQAMLYAVMKGNRRLGVENAKRLAGILNIDKAICRPDIWG